MSNSREASAEALSLIQNALEQSDALVEELREELRRRRPSKNELEKRLDVLQHRLDKCEQDRDTSRREAAHSDELVENANAKIEQLKAKLEIAESGPDKLTKKEVNYWRAQAESFDEQTAEYKARLVSLRQELNTRDAELTELKEALSKNDEAAVLATDSHDQLSEVTARNRIYEEQLATASAEQDRLTAERDTMKSNLAAALSQRDQVQERLTQAEIFTETAQTANARSLDSLTEKINEREKDLREQGAQRALLEAENLRLNEELGEERDRSDAVSELANERLDQLTKFRERYEEIEERFEESEWRRRSIEHFERIVQRRKGLISALITTIRSKSKANSALKAGLDSLRRYKAAAQATEQKLLAEIERLKSKFGEAKESLERYKDATLNQKRLSDSNLQVSKLDERAESQAELINSLEEELQLSKVIQTDLSQKIVDAQNELSGQQKAIDEVSAAAHADRENDRLMIDALERETATLRDKLANQSASSEETDASGGELSAEVEIRDAKIQELTEEMASWKRKYEFLAADAPEAYQTQAAAEK
jgi:chromosome segregation ATPase